MTRPSRQVLPQDALDDTDRAILNALQDGFPLTPRPYDDAAKPLGIAGNELISRLTRMRQIGAITRFGPFFDAAAMGGAFCLCAMEVPEDRFDEVLAQVNAHPEVAHNYERTHALNMWFVLATDRPDGIERTAQEIEAETGLKVMLFPKLEEYFIGFRVQA
ncbi:MAG TPA: Lrp/AsnC family transcriptional regulator [Paracoccus solventivorans]|uniref:Siroheme decarboxylase NirG subunit n=1 Tax=Paracoccus solventivorans TaxID=53463 RepID=A0A832PMG0_9RHOB|nr:AsnC family transcriptional regulator [Paracoccus solventivorans]HHW34388.1 Lrp/AsnC family transcriptional regulator [Paracoccus solventivorans]